MFTLSTTTKSEHGSTFLLSESAIQFYRLVHTVVMIIITILLVPGRTNNTAGSTAPFFLVESSCSFASAFRGIKAQSCKQSKSACQTRRSASLQPFHAYVIRLLYNSKQNCTHKRDIRNTEKKVVLTTKSPMFKTRFSKQVIYPHFHTVNEPAPLKWSVFTVFHYLHFLIKPVCTTPHSTRAFHISNDTLFPLYPHTAFQHYQMIINTQTRHLKGSFIKRRRKKRGQELSLIHI